jgi:hypothetical protein
MSLLYGRAGCLTTKNGGFRPGQSPRRRAARAEGGEAIRTPPLFAVCEENREWSTQGRA